MTQSWERISFDAAPFQIIDGDRGTNYPKQNDFVDKGYCLFLNTGNVLPDGFDLSQCQFVSEAKDNALRKGRLCRGDVVLTTRGTIGNIGIFDESVKHEVIRINSGMVILRTDTEKLLPTFLFHFLRSPYFKEQVNALRSGAAQPQLPIRDMKRIQLPFPDIEYQERIVTVLSAYDDLIAANQRRIQLLEESARLLYREWFVELRFPGHKTTPVRPELVEGRFDEGSNVLRQAQHERHEVPEGWNKLPLSELADVIMGQSPESKHFNSYGEGLPFHQGVSDFGDRFVTHSTFSTHATRIAHPGDILCSVRAPVGRLNVTIDKIVIGRGLSAIRSKRGTQSLLFYQLKNLFFQEDLIGGGAIFASVGKKELFGQELLQPSEEVASAFENFASGVDQQIEALTLQVRRLREARDMLLPKLMSGALDVSHIAVHNEVEA